MGNSRLKVVHLSQNLHQGESHYIPLYWADRGGSLDYRLQNFQPPYHPQTIWTWEHVWFDPATPPPFLRGR